MVTSDNFETFGGDAVSAFTNIRLCPSGCSKTFRQWMIIAVALQVAFGNVQQWASLSAAYLDVRNFRTEPPSPYNIAPGKGPVPKAASEILQSFYDKIFCCKILSSLCEAHATPKSRLFSADI